MTTATALTCHGCSYPVEEYVDEDSCLGKCCFNLASPWYMTREGLYTGTTPRGEEPEDHDERGEPECGSCGNSSFEAIEEQTVWLSVREDGGTLYVGDRLDSGTNSSRIVCESCGDRYDGRWEYE